MHNVQGELRHRVSTWRLRLVWSGKEGPALVRLRHQFLTLAFFIRKLQKNMDAWSPPTPFNSMRPSIGTRFLKTPQDILMSSKV